MDAQADAVAVLPFGGVVELDFGWVRDAVEREDLAQDLALQLDLGGVIGVLVLASAALAEVDAAGGNAIGRGGEDDERLGACVDDLAGEDEAQSVRPGGGEGAAVFRLLYLDWNE